MAAATSSHSSRSLARPTRRAHGRFRSRHSIVGEVEGLGFRAFSLGPSGIRVPKRIPLQEVDVEQEERHLRERFVRRTARERVPFLLALCADWQPDLLVCDEADFGGMVAAELLGLPHATVLVIATGSFV